MLSSRRGEGDGRVRNRKPYSARYKVSSCVGNEISIQGDNAGDGAKAERIADTRVQRKRDNDHRGRDRKRSCAYAGVMPDEYGTEPDSAIPEGEIITADTRRVSRVEETILGTALVGEGILLRDGRERNERDGTAVYQ